LDPRVQKVLVLMEGNLRRKLSVSKMAQLVNLSPSHLHRLFKSETGKTPAIYLKDRRMKKAQELLESTTLSVKEVARKVGVSDDSHFVRDFKKALGLTPARYRALFFSRRSPGK
jgi:transcriptional regulator GlxA family with amidase domain